MSRSTVAVASFALLVTTAGCGGVLGDDETRTPYDVDGTPTPTPTETATATPDPVTVEPTEEPVRAPPRLAENLSNQIERLSVADSYTAQVEFTVTRDGTTRRSETVTYLVDNEAKRGLQNGTYRQPETGTEVVSVYHDPDVFRQREVGAGGEVEYRTPRVDAVTPPNMTPANNTKVRLGALTGGLETTALERDGTATFDGQEMVHYAATRPEAAPESAWDDLWSSGRRYSSPTVSCGSSRCAWSNGSATARRRRPATNSS
jgi:hypothetical protein